MPKILSKCAQEGSSDCAGEGDAGEAVTAEGEAGDAGMAEALLVRLVNERSKSKGKILRGGKKGRDFLTYPSVPVVNSSAFCTSPSALAQRSSNS